MALNGSDVVEARGMGYVYIPIWVHVNGAPDAAERRREHPSKDADLRLAMAHPVDERPPAGATPRLVATHVDWGGQSWLNAQMEPTRRRARATLLLETSGEQDSQLPPTAAFRPPTSSGPIASVTSSEMRRVRIEHLRTERVRHSP
jgi:hypothetical protein